jgi:hypothetical protein
LNTNKKGLQDCYKSGGHSHNSLVKLATTHHSTIKTKQTKSTLGRKTEGRQGNGIKIKTPQEKQAEGKRILSL